MHSCSLHKLAQSASPDNSKTISYRLSQEKLSQLSDIRLKSLYDRKPDYAAISSQPWKNLPKYFKNVLISALALVKMSIHAKLGGSIEIMGMLTGKIIGTSIIVMDVYSLPVEGTETRVNAQNEAYEYMVQYLDLMNSAGREEHIVGWYHSHPGYGCWLSGIDVATQSLNQNFQDPYLAIVVDPVQLSNQGKIEIGAFRTLPMEYESREGSKGKNVNTRSKEKMKDFGIHADQYYALDIELFKSRSDEECIDMILNKSWAANLFYSENASQEYDRRLIDRVEQLMSELNFAREVKEPKYFKHSFEALVSRPVKEVLHLRHLREQLLCGATRGESDEEVVDDEGDVDGENDEDDDEDDEDDDEDDEDNEDDDEEQASKTASDRDEAGDDEGQMETEEEQSLDGEPLEIGNAKKRLHSTDDSRTSIREGERQQSSTHKRLATGDVYKKLSNELKAKTQKAHSKLREDERQVAAVGHSELLLMLVKRAQRKVFGEGAAI